MPARRTEVDGDFEEPLSVQWGGTADRIERVLQAGGWRRPPPWASHAALFWLLPSTSAGQLPVLAKLHQGAPPTLTLEKVLDPTRRLVMRLWATSYRVDTAKDSSKPLWIGTATLERLSHPAGIVTIAVTDQNFAAPTAQLAQLLRQEDVALVVKYMNMLAVLLVR